MGRPNSPDDVFKSINTHNNNPSVCWEWTGALGGRDGRGYMTLNGRKQLAHRIVYQIFNGPIADGLVIRHKCDNPVCCNPFHLELGNRSENELDKYRRNRAGLPRDVVVEIRRMAKFIQTDKALAEYIAGKFQIKISRSAVQRIRSGDKRSETK